MGAPTGSLTETVSRLAVYLAKENAQLVTTLAQNATLAASIGILHVAEEGAETTATYLLKYNFLNASEIPHAAFEHLMHFSRNTPGSFHK